MRWDVVVAAEDGRTFDLTVDADDEAAAVERAIAEIQGRHPGTTVDTTAATPSLAAAEVELHDGHLLVGGEPIDARELAPGDLAARIEAWDGGHDGRALADELARALGLPVAFRPRR